MRGSRVVLVGAATLAGAALGWAAAHHETARHRGALFDRRPRRRFAALLALETRPAPDTVHLLRDYLRWEQHPMLRRRARRHLRRLETAPA